MKHIYLLTKLYDDNLQYELGGMTWLTVALNMNTTFKISDLNWSEIKCAMVTW